MLRNLNLTLQQMRLFDAVARHKSYTRASEELHLTQPAVSIQIKRLEENLERKLIEVIGKKLFLTPAGERVYEHTQLVLKTLDQLKFELNNLDAEISGELKIALVSPAKYVMPYIFDRFLKMYPKVVPQITVGNRTQIIEALQQNEHDLAITGNLSGELKVKSQPFFRSDLVVIAHPNHPLAKKINVTIKELTKHKLVLREHGSGIRATMEEIFSENNLELKPFMEFGSTESIKQTVMAGIGVSVLPIHAIRLEIKHKYLKTLPVEGFPLPRSWYITHLEDVELSATAKAFIDLICHKDINELIERA